MSAPVARLNDPHSCPASTGSTPHIGGPLVGPGMLTVLVEGQPIAVVGDLASCSGPPDTLIAGSGTVQAGGKPIVRAGDATAHGGVVTSGATSVLAGS
ncbi:MAG: PAAR domain-containing protein [bacterium]|nr:PAAR domain-containing protein [bacterium]